MQTPLPIPAQRPIAITMGDAAGIGPEIIARLYHNDPDLCKATLVVGDVQTLRRASALVARVSGGLALPVLQLQQAEEALQAPPVAYRYCKSPRHRGTSRMARSVPGRAGWPVNALCGRPGRPCRVSWPVWLPRPFTRKPCTRRERLTANTPVTPKCCKPQPHNTWANRWSRCRFA